MNENFFEREEIKVIENMPNGKDYIIFYLKLLLKSISTEGKLKFRNVIPYTPEMLSAITGTDIDTVRVAIELFTKLDLMEIWDDGTLFMIETQNMIGSETDSARRVRKHRQKKALEEKEENNEMLQSNTDVTKGNGEVIKSNTDIDIEKDIDIDKDKEDISMSQQSSDEDKPIKPEYEFGEDSTEIALARFMINEMLRVKPDSKVPKSDVKSLQNWAKHIDYMIRLDKREPRQIAELFRWAQNDTFWVANIRSPQKLRKQWDTLELRRAGEKKPKQNVNLAYLEEMYREAKAEEDGLI